MATPKNIINYNILSKLCLDKLPIHSGDKLDIYPLGTGSHAFIMVGAVTKATFCHGVGHVLDTRCSFALALWQNRQLGNFGTGEEHG